MISTKGRYALRLMINLALYSDGNYVRLKDISEKEEISIKYLEQVVALLYKSNLVLSLRGNNGGYKLAREPKDYTAGEILRAAEGTLSPVQCLSCPVNTCQRQSICSTLDFWKGFNNAVNNYVDNVTLADLVEQYKAKFESDYSI